MIISEKSTNKSHAMELPMLPIHDREKSLFKKYKEQLNEYNSTEGEEKKRIKEPICPQLLINDITPEAIAQVLSINPRGLGYFRDELTSWIKDFNRYRKGSDEQFWLTNYNSGFCRINRTGKSPIFINDSFISVFGSLHPGVLKDIFSGDRNINGFVERILPIFLENVQKPYFNEEELPDEILENYVTLMNQLLEINPATYVDGEITPIILQFEPKAKNMAVSWHNQNVDETNNAGNAERAMVSKSDMGFYRLCLILQVLIDAEKGSTSIRVEVLAVERAIKLIEYFKFQAKKVIAYNEKNNSPLNDLSELQVIIYSRLPNEFATGEAVEIADLQGMPSRTFMDFLKKEKLFVRLKHGNYRKVIVAQPAQSAQNKNQSAGNADNAI